MPVDGGEAWQLTDAPSGVDAFEWSPQGDRIAYTSTDTVSSDVEEARRRRSATRS